MDSLDTVLRLMVIGQVLLISLVLAVRGPRRVSIPLVLLMTSVAAYLVKSSATLTTAVPFASVPVLLLAMAAPYLVWVCANALFDFERPPTWVMVLFPAATAMCCFEIVNGGAPAALRALSMSTSLFVVLHAVYSIVRGSLDDLSERRRWFRLCFVGCISLVAAFIIAMELTYLGGTEPGWLPLTNAGLIAAVILFISVPLLTRPADLLPQRPEEEQPAPERAALSVADQETYTALVAAMENRAYARTGLTIRQLAEELSTPEHQLRALINQRLGYKNFSTFLNGYRIDETCARLTDPKEARVPILTIALDAGFASLTPFNRAFREARGMTPSEYRRVELKPSQVVTPLRQ